MAFTQLLERHSKTVEETDQSKTRLDILNI